MSFELSKKEEEEIRAEIRAEPWYLRMTRLNEELGESIEAANRAFGFPPMDAQLAPASRRRR
jgi:hypothetical protein